MRFITSLILIISIGVLSIFSFIQLNKIISVCETAKTYRIGTVDPRFGITKEELLKASEEAASNWNNAYPTQLLRYDQTGEITINMVFDERQSFLSEIGALESSLEDRESALDLQNQDFDQQAAEFENKLNNLNKTIQEWNEKGGAPPEQYNKIVAEQKILKQEAERLNNLARELNRSVASFNVEVGQVNKAVSSFNETLTEKPEGGLFIGSENRIEIYINESRKDLNRILAHEMGHAIGIGHVANPNSIMYPESNDQSKLSNEDIAALIEVCEGEKVFDLILLKLNTLEFNF